MQTNPKLLTVNSLMKGTKRRGVPKESYRTLSFTNLILKMCVIEIFIEVVKLGDYYGME